MSEETERQDVAALNRRIDVEAGLSYGAFRTLHARLTDKYGSPPLGAEEAADLVGRLECLAAIVDGVIGAMLRMQDVGADEPLPPLPEGAAEIFSVVELALDAHGVRAPTAVGAAR